MTNSAEATVLEARRLITALGSWLPPTANCTIQQNPQLTKLKQLLTVRYSRTPN
jgi:hypothetical protein